MLRPSLFRARYILTYRGGIFKQATVWRKSVLCFDYRPSDLTWHPIRQMLAAWRKSQSIIALGSSSTRL